jgi:nitrogen fixation protein
MIRSNPIRSLSALLAALVISSCSDSAFRSPTAPVDQPLAGAANGSIKAGLARSLPNPGNLNLTALWWKKPHKDVITVSKVIDASGGTITMSTGLNIVFPQGALSAPLTITVTSDNKYVAYKMEPSGTTFLKDVTVTQLLDGIQIPAPSLRSQLFAAYIADDNAKLVGKIPVIELEPSSAILSPATGLPQAQVWIIRHFSRYMLASD